MQCDDVQEECVFLSPYQKIYGFEVDSDIQCFDIYIDMLYIVLDGNVSIFDLTGKYVNHFAIEAEVRDIVVENEMIYLLYPTSIVLYNFEGDRKETWEACSENTFTLNKNSSSPMKPCGHTLISPCSFS
ncbi:MAG: hypothetical protein FWC10_03030 [Lentimicrobiaceae bacterium]|nr:hypothetical protein [Lentimicrobiaceae bacterium]